MEDARDRDRAPLLATGAPPGHSSRLLLPAAASPGECWRQPPAGAARLLPRCSCLHAALRAMPVKEAVHLYWHCQVAPADPDADRDDCCIETQRRRRRSGFQKQRCSPAGAGVSFCAAASQAQPGDDQRSLGRCLVRARSLPSPGAAAAAAGPGVQRPASDLGSGKRQQPSSSRAE